MRRGRGSLRQRQPAIDAETRARARRRAAGVRAAFSAPHLVEHRRARAQRAACFRRFPVLAVRSEEHTSELQSLMRRSYAVFCLQNNTSTRLLKYNRPTI